MTEEEKREHRSTLHREVDTNNRKLRATFRATRQFRSTQKLEVRISKSLSDELTKHVLSALANGADTSVGNVSAANSDAFPNAIVTNPPCQLASVPD